MEVRYVDFGMANNHGTHIELNEKLKQYPNLHNALLKHELEHTIESFSLKDYYLDAFPNEDIPTKEFWDFAKKNPKAFLQQYLPIYFRHGKICYNINLLISYIMLSLIVGVTIYTISLG